MAGRKSKYCEEIALKIADFIREGLTIKDACYGVGISTDTFARWRNRYPEFNELIAEASYREWGTASAVAKYGYRSYKRKEAYILPKLSEKPHKPPHIAPQGQSFGRLTDMNSQLPVRFTVPDSFPCKPYINGNNGWVEWKDKNNILCTCTYEKYLEKQRRQRGDALLGLII